MKSATIVDYPLAETRSDLISGKRGLSLDDITLDAVLNGRVTMEDLQISPQALAAQAEIANAAHRPTLALNLARAAELVAVPQDLIMSTYEMLRPGRAASKQELLDRAELFRTIHAATGIADFIAQAAEIYDQRGLFTYRF